MSKSDPGLFPLFLKLAGRPVLLVGGGAVATAKARALAEVGASLTVVAPELLADLVDLCAARGWSVRPRPFESADLDGAWLVIAAAPPEVNRQVAAAAEARRLFLIAVDDPQSASAYGAGVVRRAGVTLAVSTSGAAPALAGLLREGLEALLPDDLDAWVAEAARARAAWRAERVPMPERRPRLLEAINELYRRRPAGVGDVLGPAASEAAPARGRVTLVGAGPGDPDLLTVRGARRLSEADLVLYDALSSEAMRAYAPGARWFYVGKRACRQSIGQDVLNRLMIRHARRGRHVVRLKCGDPFVFGRGGEEVLALAEAGIPCEVIPGVSTAIAGPGLAGIPVTHRGAAGAFVVVAGHHEETYRPVLAALPTRGVTVVVMMGLGRRAAIAALLGELGWDAGTPAAVVLGAATPAAWRWTGTLAGLGAVEISAAGADDRAAPGLLIVGDVVSVAAEVERLYARGAAGAATSVGREGT